MNPMKLKMKQSGPQKRKEEMEEPTDDWTVSIQVMLGSLFHGQVLACSISSVTDELRNPNEAAFKPKEVSIGPLHRETTRRVQLMERTKWSYMRFFLDRKEKQEKSLIRNCHTAIIKLEEVIIASYGGNIKSESRELAKMMIVDGCFLLELLIRLADYVEKHNGSCSNSKDPVLGNEKKIVSILSDITMLENQIPFIVLKKLYRKVFPDDNLAIQNDHRVAEIVKRAFHCPNVNNLECAHILHLMHLSTVELEQNHQEGKPVKQELLLCATRLLAAGIRIEAEQTNTTVHELVDWFNFGISLSDTVLRIPALEIKETTEVKWRNLIAWEQSMIGIRCKYTSYGLFFQGLVCCKHDIELLEEKKVIINKAGKSKKELLNLFRTISKGAEYMDSSYEEIYESLSMYQGQGRILRIMRGLPIVTWHNFRHGSEIIMYYWGNWYKILIHDHIPTVWKLIGVLAAAILLVATIMQTYYSSPKGR